MAVKTGTVGVGSYVTLGANNTGILIYRLSAKADGTIIEQLMTEQSGKPMLLDKPIGTKVFVLWFNGSWTVMESASLMALPDDISITEHAAGVLNLGKQAFREFMQEKKAGNERAAKAALKSFTSTCDLLKQMSQNPLCFYERKLNDLALNLHYAIEAATDDAAYKGTYFNVIACTGNVQRMAGIQVTIGHVVDTNVHVSKDSTAHSTTYRVTFNNLRGRIYLKKMNKRPQGGWGTQWQYDDISPAAVEALCGSARKPGLSYKCAKPLMECGMTCTVMEAMSIGYTSSAAIFHEVILEFELTPTAPTLYGEQLERRILQLVQPYL